MNPEKDEYGRYKYRDDEASYQERRSREIRMDFVDFTRMQHMPFSKIVSILIVRYWERHPEMGQLLQKDVYFQYMDVNRIIVMSSDLMLALDIKTWYVHDDYTTLLNCYNAIRENEPEYDADGRILHGIQQRRQQHTQQL